MTTDSIPELGFQRCSDGTVRAIRFNGNELIGTRNVGDLSTAVAVVDSFRRDFPRGKVSVESLKDPYQTAPLRKGGQLAKLFQGDTR